MVEPNERKLYRNSDLNGNPIPLDILLSKGLVKQAFTSVAVNDIDLPDDTELLIIYADPAAPCYIQLDGAAALPANGIFVPGLHFIPADTIKTIDSNGALKFGVISAGALSGTLVIECAYAYKDSRRPKQHSNA